MAIVRMKIDMKTLVTVRNWEQGKRSPTGAARALLRILDRAPTEVLFSVL